MRLGHAHDGLEHTEEALQIYLSVARELGDAAPPVIYLMIARSSARFGRRGPAREWLRKAERFAAGKTEIEHGTRQRRSYLQQAR